MGTGDLRSERSVGDRWNHYATREPHGRSLFWILQDIPVWFIVSRGSSVTHKKQINVEAVNGNSLLTLEGIWFFFYQLVVCSTECVCFWKGMCCCFFFFCCCSKFSLLLWGCSVFICTSCILQLDISLYLSLTENNFITILIILDFFIYHSSS